MTFDEMTMRAARDKGVRILETAAARLRDNGWTRDRYGPPEGPNCVMGAVRCAAWELTVRLDHPGHTDRGYLAAEHALTRAVGDRDPINWNDTICPDEETAVDALLTAAKELANADT